jgi:hypothetical protein
MPLSTPRRTRFVNLEADRQAPARRASSREERRSPRRRLRRLANGRSGFSPSYPRLCSSDGHRSMQATAAETPPVSDSRTAGSRHELRTGAASLRERLQGRRRSSERLESPARLRCTSSGVSCSPVGSLMVSLLRDGRHVLRGVPPPTIVAAGLLAVRLTVVPRAGYLQMAAPGRPLALRSSLFARESRAAGLSSARRSVAERTPSEAYS